MVQQINSGIMAGDSFFARHSSMNVHVEINIEQKFSMSPHAREIIYHVAQSSRLSSGEKAWAVRMAAFIDEFAGGNEQLFAKLGGVIQLMETTSGKDNYPRQSANEWADYYQKVRETLHAGGGIDGDVKITFDAQLEEFVFESRGISLAEQQGSEAVELPNNTEYKTHDASLDVNPRGRTRLPLNRIA